MKLTEAIDDYGPCLATDPEMGIAVTLNGAYFNVWTGGFGGGWTNTEAYDAASRLESVDREDCDPFNPLKDVPLWECVEAAEDLLNEILEMEA